MRSSDRNNPFELQRANAPPNPFMSGSCDKHLTSSEWRSPPFVKGMRSIHRLGRHVRRRRIESEEEEKMQRGSSNPLKHFLGPPSTSSVWQRVHPPAVFKPKKIKDLQSVFTLADSWPFLLAAN